MRKFIVVWLAVLLVGNLVYMFFGCLSTQQYMITKHEVDEDAILFEGWIVNSSMRFTKYLVSFDGENIWIKVYGRVILGNNTNNSGSFEIQINKADYQGAIKKVYVMGYEPGDKRLIWEVME